MLVSCEPLEPSLPQFAGAQEAWSVPASFAGKRAQRRWTSRRDDRHVNILREVMSNSIPAIDPRGTHWARTGLFLPVNHLIDHKRAIRRREQFAQPYGF